MQTDILLKQLQSSLAELKISIEKFEKHPSPSTQYAENLHLSIQQNNKLVSAYVVLKEHKDLSPDLNLHLKIMNEQQPEEKMVVLDSKAEVNQVTNFAPKVTEDDNSKDLKSIYGNSENLIGVFKNSLKSLEDQFSEISQNFVYSSFG